MEIKPIQSRQLHFQAPLQRQMNLDFIKVCSLTWGWANSTSLGFVLSSASTAPPATQHSPRKQAAFVPCWWLPVPPITANTVNTSVSSGHVVRALVSLGRLGAHSYVSWHSQSPSKNWSPEHCRYSSVQIHWPVVLASLSGVVSWDGLGESFFLFIVINSPAFISISPFLHRALAHWTLK